MGRIEKHSVKAEAPPPDQAGLMLEGVSVQGAVSGISLTAQPGAVLALLGGAAAGKSTLLRLLAGAITPPRATCSMPAPIWPVCRRTGGASAWWRRTMYCFPA